MTLYEITHKIMFKIILDLCKLQLEIIFQERQLD